MTKILEGFLLINKPAGLSSFQCVSRIKKLVSKGTRVGHAGTLDTFASGLLIIGISRQATRELSKIMKLDKCYRAQAKLGQLTDSLDTNGILIKEESAVVTREQLEKAIHSFGAGYTQTPPLFSALKHEGISLSDWARSGKIPAEQLAGITAHKQRHIHLHKLELREFTPPFFTIFAHVSHGTYIRVLMNDSAVRAGTCATTHILERTKIGPFKIDDATKLYDLDSPEAITRQIISREALLSCL